ncbi:Serine/threonine-protein kinase [Wickerhamomyces ciferrii]|uniref:Serine/threonine-protein kinase BUR1 n=1 Tax=Wickerhamomyces ciferrii (strain ATCC 14091 / BCRC 22168 / CBS 111 / JCM 3599 / NBRC 0793 / NRRL Y-1031 F-60-10) TaxID=1206466 RepID=K0KVY2_WICCF|nr:Serine/threonine-protein kinase [Wickerhamomyces ciferrii]CCH45664.1 Serine/threonine-protein kinase [Wickerhamomyces ciferrii]
MSLDNQQQQLQQPLPPKSHLATPNIYSPSSTPLSHRSSPAPPRSKEFQFTKTKRYYGVVKLNQYKILKQLGKGTFGVVFKGQDRTKNHYVAIKRIIRHSKSDGFPITAFREITILKELQESNNNNNDSNSSENIIELLDMIHDRPAPNDDYENYDPNRIDHKIRKDFFMVFPYMSFDLTGILGNPDIRLKETDIKSIMKQLLKGINFIHSKNFLHRDIKASNILIDVNGIVKIADFGLARDYIGPIPTKALPGGGNQPLTEVVMTRWYRAPEVLFGDRNYTTAVDIWGIGCVFGELYERKPILPGKSDLQQVYDIFQLVGDANLENYPNLNMDKINEKKIILKNYEPNIFKRFKNLMLPEGIELLKEMLTLYPMSRITGVGALDHPYFHTNPLPTDTVDINFNECHEADIPKFKELQKNQQQQQQLQKPTNPLSRRPPPSSSIIPQNKALPIKPPLSAGSIQSGPIPPGPTGPVAGPITSNSITQQINQHINPQLTRPRSNFIKDNRQQRSAHPQDLETPPPVPFNNNSHNHNNNNNNNFNHHNNYGNYGGNQGGYHDYRSRNSNNQQYRSRNYGNYGNNNNGGGAGNWGNSNSFNGYTGGYQDDFNSNPKPNTIPNTIPNPNPNPNPNSNHIPIPPNRKQQELEQQQTQQIPSKRPYPNPNELDQQAQVSGQQDINGNGLPKYYPTDKNFNNSHISNLSNLDQSGGLQRKQRKYSNDRYQNYGNHYGNNGGGNRRPYNNNNFNGNLNY